MVPALAPPHVTPPRPTIAPDAAEIIRAETAVYGPLFELEFCAQFDAVLNAIVSVELVMRGSRGRVLSPSHVFPYGSLALHTHPLGSLIEPSDADLEAAHSQAQQGVGFGICSTDARELFIVATPRMVALRSKGAELARSRRWKLGPLCVLLFPGIRLAQLTCTY